jgi:hypothetical protein
MLLVARAQQSTRCGQSLPLSDGPRRITVLIAAKYQLRTASHHPGYSSLCIREGCQPALLAEHMMGTSEDLPCAVTVVTNVE